MSGQVIIQDTLKFLAECEYEGEAVSREELARELSVSQEQANQVLGDLGSAQFIDSDTLKLTKTGREYALYILRAHRLYETYLAHKTGVTQDHWHRKAHVREHTLSAADVESLDRQLDFPRFDPHGDPIPSATGLMPPKRGQPLTDFPTGWEGRVVHVEDKPPHLYALITRANIAPRTVLRIAEKSDKEMQVLTEGCAFQFSTETARQITVEALEEGEHFDESLERLSSLVEGEQATVVGLSGLCCGLERSRLLDLGLVPGTPLSVDLYSPSGSPIAYRVRGASIALRREQTERVLIHKVKKEAKQQ